ncbi:MAG: ABC transporter permease [Anaerolineae bacterium]|nr:ABC transporter permease [Anaerolineae bacterium]MDW8171588.1 ABC transporter permease [Anaerolineae bacterium]
MRAWRDFVFGLLPISFSLLVTALLIVLVGKDPLEVARVLWSGAFGTSETLASVVNFWIPLTLAALGLVVTFRAGLWNIGVEGQIMIGAVAASGVALYVKGLPSPLLIGLSMAAAVMAGALLGALIGFLKLRLGVNEIFGGVALNALVNVASIYLISGPWQPAEGGSAQATSPFPMDARLPLISPIFPTSLLMLVLTVLAIGLIIRLLSGTRWGLQLKAVGKNPRSALLLGVPTGRSVFSALALCGLLAGLGGAHRVLDTYYSLRPLVSGGIGFLALLVVLLAAMRALWAPLIAFVFAAILGGTTRVRIRLQLDPSLAGVLQGLIVLTVVLFQGIRERYFAHHDESIEEKV